MLTTHRAHSEINMEIELIEEKKVWQVHALEMRDTLLHFTHSVEMIV